MDIQSFKGDVVLDPFNGSGQTTKVAKHLNRHYIGFDNIPEYVELARNRLNEALILSNMKFVEKWGTAEPFEMQIMP